MVPGQQDRNSPDLLRLPQYSDSKDELKTALRIPKDLDAEATVVVNVLQGDVVFFADYLLRPDFLRQLSERFVHNRIDYSTHSLTVAASFKKGAHLPPMTVRRLAHSGAEEPFVPRSSQALLVILTPAAPTCWIKGYERQFKEFEERAAAKGERLYVLFSPHFDQDVLNVEVQKQSLPRETLFLPAGQAWLDAYETRYELTETHILVVSVGTGGLVTSVERISLGTA